MNPITVQKNGDKYIAKFRFDYETKDHVKAAGFRFDGTTKQWWTADQDIAEKIGAKIEAPTLALVPASLGAPDGLEYLPYQRAGIEHMRTRINVLLADEMGLGKTIQAIGLINAKPEIKKVLIVCPASLKLNWKSELMKWSTRPFLLQVIDSGSELLLPEAGIVILNYEQVGKHRNSIMRQQWDLLICDESHYLKNSKSQRTQNIVGRWDDDPSKRLYPIKAAQRLFMTGTPVLNRPKELWTTVRALDRQGLGEDWHHFHVRYCAGYKDSFGWQIDGASNLDELNDRLRRSIMLRRKKADVLTELPPKRRQIIMLEPTTNAARQALKNEQELLAIESELSALRAEVEALSVNQADARYKAAVQKMNAFEGVAFSDTSRVRHQTALAKLPMVMDYLVNVLDNEGKIVVFAHHHDVIDGIAGGLAEFGVLTYDGRTDMKLRHEIVQRFQTDPKIRVVIGSIGAMGTGVTLTAASYVAFAELDWVPGNLNQAEDRLHRIGQTESILVQHLMLDGSFDGRMAKTIVHKQHVIERAVG